MVLNNNNNKIEIEKLPENTVNSKVNFSTGRVANILRKLEKFLGIPLSLRSTTGEVVCKTDYFYGPCSFIRGSELGCKRCRKVYKTIENKVLKRKVPYVCVCYCGFLIYAVPLELRSEMVGILIASQIIPITSKEDSDKFKNKLLGQSKSFDLSENKDYIESFDKIKTLDQDTQRIKFLSYMEEIAHHFVEMALSEKPWNIFLKEIKMKKKDFGKF